MMKAIRITSENKSKLEVQYDMGEGYLDLSSGLYIVAGDGNAQFEGVLTQKKLTENFYRTGKKLANDFFEVMPRSSVQATPEFSDA